jgi:hypothetical protein
MLIKFSLTDKRAPQSAPSRIQQATNCALGYLPVDSPLFPTRSKEDERCENAEMEIVTKARR